MSRYRPEIDGLRAIAVLSVIFCHYLPAAFPGGFAGVDLFFVISGFLITDHIASEIGANRFSLLAFYERRIRRIVPALVLMYVLVLLSSSAILFSRDWHFQSRVAAYVIPFLGNYALYQNAGAYGGELAAHIPLLHTWSLAVEEQFYLLFPLLMLAVQRFARGRYSTVLWILTVVSFVLCVAGVRVAPLATFYLPQFRAWELLMGALLAVGGFSPPGNARVRAVVTLSGLLLIAGADLFLSATHLIPANTRYFPVSAPWRFSTPPRTKPCLQAGCWITASCGVSGCGPTRSILPTGRYWCLRNTTRSTRSPSWLVVSCSPRPS